MRVDIEDLEVNADCNDWIAVCLVNLVGAIFEFG